MVPATACHQRNDVETYRRDNVWQISATMASDAWASPWQSVVLSALGSTVSKNTSTLSLTLPWSYPPSGFGPPPLMPCVA